MAKKKRKAKKATPERFTATARAKAAEKEQYEVRQIENVPEDEVDALIVEEQQTNPRFLFARAIPEGDGEFTVILVYRRAS